MTTNASLSDEDRALQQRIAAGAMVERADEMTPAYRRELTKMLQVAGDTELRSVPMLFDYFAIGVPYRYVQPIISIAQDELGHAHLDYQLLAALGEDVEALVYERPAERWVSPYMFDMPIESWAEIAAVEGLGEFVGGLLVGNVYGHTSYGPWRRALARVVAEESFHVKFGKSIMRELARDADGRHALQQAVDWLFPLLLEFMGPPGRAVDPQLDFQLKGKRVDDLRQEYLRFACPLCAELGLSVPAHLEPDLGVYVLDFAFPCAFDVERKRWDLGCAVPWSAVFERWKARGPRADEHLAWLRRSRRALAEGSSSQRIG